jgi:hypothetical protein
MMDVQKGMPVSKISDRLPGRSPEVQEMEEASSQLDTENLSSGISEADSDTYSGATGKREYF